jgi:diketogulonate reductase-like aldo/keto reductase
VGTWNGSAPTGQLAPEQRGTHVNPNILERPLPRDVRIGSARMPILILSTDPTYGDDVVSRIDAALTAGIRAFDCASMYGNEDAVGSALAASLCQREELFIISKVCIELEVSRKGAGSEQCLHCVESKGWKV